MPPHPAAQDHHPDQARRTSTRGRTQERDPTPEPDYPTPPHAARRSTETQEAQAPRADPPALEQRRQPSAHPEERYPITGPGLSHPTQHRAVLDRNAKPHAP